MNFRNVVEKGRRKLLKKRSKILFNTPAHSFLYYSYWHSIFVRPSKSGKSEQFLTSEPNRGAGIGHQLANYIAGLWFSKLWGLEFVHSEFSANWDSVLGLGNNMKKAHELKSVGYKVVRLPLFKENDHLQIKKTRRIINSYEGKKVLFLTDFDQFYADQYGIMNHLQELFYNSPARVNDKIEFNKNSINIACHIRRGDIMQNKNAKNANLSMRFQSGDYYIRILDRLLEDFPSTDNIQIYIYSQGKESDFIEFQKYKNVHYRINSDQYSSFLHMVYADILITSKSSYSYKPALLSRSLKICPQDFWHGYPDSEDFILVDNEGNFLKNCTNKINQLLNSKL